MTPNNDQKPKDTTEATSPAGVSCAAPTGYALTCEHAGCNATENVADYVRYTSDLDDDDEGDDLTAEEREDWMHEPIALCPAHAGCRSRHSDERTRGGNKD